MALIQQEHPWHCIQVRWSIWAPRGPAQALGGAGTSICSILWHQCPWNLAPDSLTPLKCCLSRDTQHRGQQKATSSNGVPAGGPSQLYQCVFRGHRMWLFYTAIVQCSSHLLGPRVMTAGTPPGWWLSEDFTHPQVLTWPGMKRGDGHGTRSHAVPVRCECAGSASQGGTVPSFASQ